jgi:DNA-3-methyladenine glycosylase
MPPLPRSFYTRRTITVARELLGKILVRSDGSELLSGRIVETEAYLSNDPACHAYRGVTDRTRIMFGVGGFLYVYFTYGMHYCANVVTNREGLGEAVLIRALEPMDGIEVMTKRRGIPSDHQLKSDRQMRTEDGAHLKGGLHLKNLTNGPAKLAQAFGLTTAHSGADLVTGSIYITDDNSGPTPVIVSTTRIGISVAQEKKWRFYIKGNMWVSKK